MSGNKTGGLAGVSAGETAICTVGKEGVGLNYRGYSIHDLAEYSSFEEVAYLLIYSHLPNQRELDDYKARLKSMRSIPGALKIVLDQLPANAHPMDVLRTATSVLGCIEPETSIEEQQKIADRLISVFPGVLLYWYHRHHNGNNIDGESDEDSIAGHFLHLLHGKAPSELHRRN